MAARQGIRWHHGLLRVGQAHVHFHRPLYVQNDLHQDVILSLQDHGLRCIRAASCGRRVPLRQEPKQRCSHPAFGDSYLHNADLLGNPRPSFLQRDERSEKEAVLLFGQSFEKDVDFREPGFNGYLQLLLAVLALYLLV